MVPNEKFIEEVEKAIPQKSTPLLVACKAGPRSKQASDVLASAGYQDIIEVSKWIASASLFVHEHAGNVLLQFSIPCP